MNLCSDSNGTTAEPVVPLGVDAGLHPEGASAPSVGSPDAALPAARRRARPVASLHTAIDRAPAGAGRRAPGRRAGLPSASMPPVRLVADAPRPRTRRARVTTVRTVISLRGEGAGLVRADRGDRPSVSTAGSLRMMALRRAICCTPRASVIVTRAGRPSGIAATAKPIVAEIRSSNGEVVQHPADRPASATAMPRMTRVSILAERVELPGQRGVEGSRPRPSSVWIRPISAWAPGRR